MKQKKLQFDRALRMAVRETGMKKRNWQGERIMTSEFCVAVHALVFLHHNQGFWSSESLAQNICTNPARIRKVMAKLKKANLIETKEGAVGGYRSLCDSEKVTLGQIGRAVEARFVTTSWHSGNADLKCLIASGMADIMDGLYQELAEMCKSRLDQITLRDIEHRVFHNNTMHQK